jgi:hypothetical protein
MELKWRFALQISLPIIFCTFMTIVLSLYNSYTEFYYIIDRVTNDMTRSQLSVFDAESLLIQETVTRFFYLANQPVLLASDLRHRLVTNYSLVKAKFSGDMHSLNSKYYEMGYYPIELDPSCNCSYKYSTWYYDDEILVLEDLKKIRVPNNHYILASSLKTVLSPYMRVKYNNANSLFEDFYIGFYSGLYYQFPTRYVGVFREYDCTAPRDVCDQDRKCTKYEVKCRYWYNQTLIEGTYRKPSFLLPCTYNSRILQESCMALWESSENFMTGSMCVEVNTYPFYIFQNEYLFGLRKSIKVYAYTMDSNQTVIYHPNIKLTSQEFYFNLNITQVEFTNSSSTEAKEFSQQMDEAIKILEKHPNSKQSFRYTGNDQEKMIVTLLPVAEGLGRDLYILGIAMEDDALTRRIDMLEDDVENDLIYVSMLSGLVLLSVVLMFAKLNYAIIKFIMNPFYDLTKKLEKLENGYNVSFLNEGNCVCYEISKLCEVFEKFKTITLMDDTRHFNSYEAALSIYTNALRLFEEVSNFKGIYYCCYHLGLLYCQSGTYNRSANMLDRCIQIASERGFRCSSLHTITAGLIISYRNLDLASNIHVLFAEIQYFILESDLAGYILLECEYRISKGYPIHNFISILKEQISDPSNEPYLQKYYYYKGLMHKYNRMFKSSAICFHKALLSSQHFDPHLRLSILTNLQELYAEVCRLDSINIPWITRYISSLSKTQVDIVIIHAISQSKSNNYIKLVKQLFKYAESGDRHSYIACNDRSVIFNLNEESEETICNKIDDSDTCVLYDSIADAVRVFECSDKESDRWIVIMNNKIEKGSSHSLQNLISLYLDMDVNFLIYSEHEIYGLDLLLEGGGRSVVYQEISERTLDEGVRFLYCMRADPDIKISEKSIYSSYLYL